MSYRGWYYDPANRLQATVDFGTSGGGTGGNDALTARPQQPARAARDGWDVFLMDEYGYDAAGHLSTHTDPRGIETSRTFDAAGHASIVREGGGQRVTRYAYDGMDRVRVIYGGAGMTTYDYRYSDTVVNSNDLLANITYPGGRFEEFQYNFQGERTSSKVQQQVWHLPEPNVDIHPVTGHLYEYDPVGRMVLDRAVSDQAMYNPVTHVYLGSYLGNQAPERGQVTWEYDALGRMLKAVATSENSQVVTTQRQYTALGQVASESTQVSRPGLAPLGPLSVQYGYSLPEFGSGQAVWPNHSRLRSITYPDSRVVYLDYTGVDNAISRPSSIFDNAGPVSNVYAVYRYMGVSTPVEQQLGAGPVLSYASREDVTPLRRPKDYRAFTSENPDPAAGGIDAGAADRYPGLDRFGRVIDQHWREMQGNVLNTVDRFQYGYDAGGNVLYAENLRAPSRSSLFHVAQASASGPESAYDSLGRLRQLSMGQLSRSQVDGRPDGVAAADKRRIEYGYSAASDDLRAADGTQVWDYGPNGEELPGYPKDLAAGNGVDAMFDAWGRVLSARLKNGATTVGEASYIYDALGRPVVVSESGRADRVAVYSISGQLLEERLVSAPQRAIAQYVWNPLAPGQVLLRDRDADGIAATGNLGRVGSGLEERIYPLHDARGDVTALYGAQRDSDATEGYRVLERFSHDAMGNAARYWVVDETFDADWRDRTAGQRWIPAIKMSMTQGGVLYRPATGRALEPDVLNLAQATIQEPYPDRWLETAVWSGMSVALTLPLFATGSGWGMIGLVAGQAVSASIERMVAGEAVGSAVWGGVLDAVGYTEIEASVTGVDPRTGGELSGWGRVLSGLEGAAGLAAGAGGALRGVARLGQLARTLAVAEVQGWARGAGIAAGGAALYATFGDPQTAKATVPAWRTVRQALTGLPTNLRRAAIGEFRMGKFLKAHPDHVILGKPGLLGSHGADYITFNRRTGDLVFWDAKWRTARRSIHMSKTFAQGSRAWANAVEEATRIVADPRALRYITPAKRAMLKDLLDTPGAMVKVSTMGFGGARGQWVFGTRRIP